MFIITLHQIEELQTRGDELMEYEWGKYYVNETIPNIKSTICQSVKNDCKEWLSSAHKSASALWEFLLTQSIRKRVFFPIFYFFKFFFNLWSEIKLDSQKKNSEMYKRMNKLLLSSKKSSQPALSTSGSFFFLLSPFSSFINRSFSFLRIAWGHVFYCNCRA